MAQSEDKVLEAISNGDDAYDILFEADPKLVARFDRVDKSMSKLLDDVKKHFPDAIYYTGSGGFNLLLGGSHSSDGQSQQELVACSGCTSISDGDF